MMKIHILWQYIKFLITCARVFTELQPEDVESFGVVFSDSKSEFLILGTSR